MNDPEAIREIFEANVIILDGETPTEQERELGEAVARHISNRIRERAAEAME
jgi:hypothetical protein